MCIGSVGSSLLCLIINTYYTGKLIHVGFWAQMRDLLPTILYAVSMALLVYAASTLVEVVWLKIIVGVITGIMYYPFVAYITHSSELRYLILLVKKRK